MKKELLSVGLLLALVGPLPAETPSFTLSGDGVLIDAGSMGKFNLKAPTFNRKDGKDEPVFEPNGTNRAKVKYGSGLELEYEIEPQEVTIRFTKGPADGKNFKFAMGIPMKFNQGGRYAFDAAEPKLLPAEKGGQFVQHGNATTFTVIDPTGVGFTIGTPGGYQGLQDNRTFGPSGDFGYQYQRDIFGKSDGSFSFTLKAAEAGPASTSSSPTAAAEPVRKILVDRFGQSTKKDYAGKVKSDEELRADGQTQTAAMAGIKPDASLDPYGGLAGSGEKYHLKKTGFFHVETVDGKKTLVTPDGNLFFQLGVCGIASTDDFTLVKGREQIYEWLPKPDEEPYRTAWREERPDYGILSFYIANWIRKFGRPFTAEEWTGQVVSRLRSWGFNSAGAFSANTEAMRAAQFPNVSFLPLGEGGGVAVLPDKIGAAKLMDPFVPGTEAALEKKFAAGVASKAGDPLLIGYFLGNEQHFEILPKLIPTYKANKVAAKGRLVSMLKEKYGDIGKFNAAWNPAKPFSDFESLNEEPLFVRTEAAAADMKEYLRIYLEAYYSLVERVFRKTDPNHLLIGSRWTPATANNKDVVEIGGNHVDVISVNYYTYAIEEGFLKKVDEWSGGKPMILSEWHYCSGDHGLGVRMELANEKDRGSAYRNYVEQAAALPFVVGTQWFVYGDQALTGRFFEGFNGEGNSVGLVDVADRPYQELVDAAKVTHARIYDVKTGAVKPFAFADSRFNGKAGPGAARTVQIPRALPGMKLDGTTSNWPGRPAEPIASSRTVEGLANPAVSGDFRLCWDDKNLYVHVQVKDPTPFKNNKSGDRLWAGDGVELFLGARDLGQGGSLTFSDRQILIGAGETAKIHIMDHPDDGKSCQLMAVKDVTGDGYVVQVALPWSVLGIDPKAGAEMLFDVVIDNSDTGDARVQQLAWNGTAKDSGDRGAWGRAKLTEN